MTDNGGEFSSDEMREVMLVLNVKVITTVADCPFQNGLCERVHAVTDMMLLKLQEEMIEMTGRLCYPGQIWQETPYTCGWL